MSGAVCEQSSGNKGYGTLYIVATPIGNAGDITERARHVLSFVDLVAAEDTRSTRNLFSLLSINNITVSNHKFNERKQVERIISVLESGGNVAVVSDAGTPCVSDPGGIIVEAASLRGIKVIAVCGASAVTAALSVCGFLFNSFSFYGFLPKGEKGLRDVIREAALGLTGNTVSPARVAVFFESPRRIKKTLRIITEETSFARICLCNDITKMHERIYRGHAEQVACEVEGNPSSEKGEYTMVVDFSRAEQLISSRRDNDIQETGNTGQSLESLIVDYMINKDCTTKDAIIGIANTGLASKKALYSAVLNLRKMYS